MCMNIGYYYNSNRFKIETMRSLSPYASTKCQIKWHLLHCRRMQCEYSDVVTVSQYGGEERRGKRSEAQEIASILFFDLKFGNQNEMQSSVQFLNACVSKFPVIDWSNTLQLLYCWHISILHWTMAVQCVAISQWNSECMTGVEVLEDLWWRKL